MQVTLLLTTDERLWALDRALACHLLRAIAYRMVKRKRKTFQSNSHVEFDLLANQQLVDDFRSLVERAANRKGDGRGWRQWGEEIFADVFSLYMTGPWALWALTELTWSTGAAMLDASDPRYPSPAIRLLLLKEILGRMSLDGASALRGFDPADAAATGSASPALTSLFRNDSACLADIADAITTEAIADGKTFAQLCAFRPADHQGARALVTLWKSTLLGAGDLLPQDTLRAARTVLAGGVAAWAEMSEISDSAQRDVAKNKITASLVPALQKSGEPVVRAAKPEAVPKVALACVWVRGEPCASLFISMIRGP